MNPPVFPSVASRPAGVPIPPAVRPLRAPAATPTDGAGRDLEWFSALVMCGWALVLALPGDSLSAPSYVAFHRMGLTETFWACAFGGIGGLRLGALYINGRSPRTPYARMVGAFFGFLAWSQIALVVYESTHESYGVYPPGLAVYSIMALAELRSLFRASYDARYVAR